MEHRDSTIRKNSKAQPAAKERVEPDRTAQTELLVGGSFINPHLIRGARADPANLNQADVLPLQRTIGNRAVQRLLAVGATGRVQRDGTAPAQPTAAEAEQRLVAALQGSALGQKALAIKNKYNVTLTWTDSGAAGYDENHNNCLINRTMDPKEVASYFVHEMHHANEFMSGRSKGAKDYNDSQEKEYIQRMVNEEIVGIVLQYEAILEIGAAPTSKNKITDLFPQYKRVREYWRNQHLKTNPEDQEGADRAGKQKCRSLVTIWVKGEYAGDWPKLAPNQFESYEMYYRRIFRESRAKSGSPP